LLRLSYAALALVVLSERSIAEEPVSISIAGLYGDLWGCEEGFIGETEGIRVTQNSLTGAEWRCDFSKVTGRILGETGVETGWNVEVTCTAEGQEWNENITLVEDWATKRLLVLMGKSVSYADLCSVPRSERRKLQEIRTR
jgi:hypothetical protein